MKIDPALGHKASFNKFQKTFGRKEQMKMRIRIFLELNDNEKKMHIQLVGYIKLLKETNPLRKKEMLKISDSWMQPNKLDK